jgi:hypothetical protein
MPRKATTVVASPPVQEVSEIPLKATYLAWIGSIHYPTIRSWVSEVKLSGVSKRLPNAAHGRALLKPGTVIFVAHDEGELLDCGDCLGRVECPACRKRSARAARWHAELETLKKNFRGDWDTEATKGQRRNQRVREQHVTRLLKECEDCSTCKGRNHFQGSTGGFVELTDGRKIDYRTYTYWLHQPGKFNPLQLVRARYMCTGCGGSGHLPIGQVFGMFVAQRVEYVTRPGDNVVYLSKTISDFTIADKDDEATRRAGKRRPGYYAMTNTGSPSLAIQRAVEHLRSAKLIAGAEIFGGFAVFKKPIRIDAKRFRGMARFSIDRLRHAI